MNGKRKGAIYLVPPRHHFFACVGCWGPWATVDFAWIAAPQTSGGLYFAWIAFLRGILSTLCGLPGTMRYGGLPTISLPQTAGGPALTTGYPAWTLPGPETKS